MVGLFFIASCNQPVKTTSVSTNEASNSDTLFLNKNLIREKYWIAYGFGTSEIPDKPMILKMINDTVVKYYFGHTGCWNENYKSWEKYFDCYKIYNDTIEFIGKLANKQQNDNKYIISSFDWTREYKKFKFYIEPHSQDTILELRTESFPQWYHTLSEFKVKYKLKFPLLLDK